MAVATAIAQVRPWTAQETIAKYDAKSVVTQNILRIEYRGINMSPLSHTLIENCKEFVPAA